MSSLLSCSQYLINGLWNHTKVNFGVIFGRSTWYNIQVQPLLLSGTIGTSHPSMRRPYPKHPISSGQGRQVVAMEGRGRKLYQNRALRFSFAPIPISDRSGRYRRPGSLARCRLYLPEELLRLHKRARPTTRASFRICDFWICPGPKIRPVVCEWPSRGVVVRPGLRPHSATDRIDRHVNGGLGPVFFATKRGHWMALILGHCVREYISSIGSTLGFYLPFLTFRCSVSDSCIPHLFVIPTFLAIP